MSEEIEAYRKRIRRIINDQRELFDALADESEGAGGNE